MKVAHAAYGCNPWTYDYGIIFAFVGQEAHEGIKVVVGHGDRSWSRIGGRRNQFGIRNAIILR